MTRIGSLCSGYGGLDLGLIAALGDAAQVAWHVEYDKHPSAVLDARWPGVPNYGDVTTIDWTQVEPIDWLTAGYPCQPFSHAGKRKGSSDERHLWPAVASAIGVLRPGRVLLENVAGRRVPRKGALVLADLAALGYVGRYGVVRAADAGAPHNRARVFIVARDAAMRGRNAAQPPHGGQPARPTRGSDIAVADACGERHGRRQDGRSLGRLDRADAGEACEWERSRPLTGDRSAAAPTDADDQRHERDGCARGRRGGPTNDRGVDWGAYEPAIRRWESITGRTAPRPTEPGRSGERLSAVFVEWLMGLPAGWVTDVLPRNPALKALGNGVVPQQAALAVRTLLSVTEEAVA